MGTKEERDLYRTSAEVFPMEEEPKYLQNLNSTNNGGSTDYYKLPEEAKDLQDLIEHKDMNFALGNIFKACYRLGECNHSDELRELNKIKWFIDREIKRLKRGTR